MKIKSTTTAVILSAAVLLFDLIFAAPPGRAQSGVPLWTNGPTATAMRGQAAHRPIF